MRAVSMAVPGSDYGGGRYRSTVSEGLNLTRGEDSSVLQLGWRHI